MTKKASYPAAVLLAIILSVSIHTAILYNVDFGNLSVDTISIPAGSYTLSGRIYVPKGAHPDHPRPAVVLAHGISGAKESLCGIALEIARRGFVSLAIDLAGHGDSGGVLSASDPSFGMSAAVRHVKSLPFVDQGAVAVVGHSLGAGAARRTAVTESIAAVAFIGGGVGGMVEDELYGVLNQTFPRNMLLAIGEHDVLFELDKIVVELQSAFDTQQPVRKGVTYGDFDNGTARRLVVSPTTHLFEPLAPTIVTEVVAWIEEAFDSPSRGALTSTDLNYLRLELCLLISLAALIALILPLSNIVHGEMAFSMTTPLRVKRWSPNSWLIAAIWGGLGLALFLPFMGLGAILPFPSQTFGSSLAWWLLGTGSIGLIVLQKLSGRLSIQRISFKTAFLESLEKRDALIAVLLVTFLYILAITVESFFKVNFQLFVPILSSIGTIDRVLAFPSYLPFCVVYFFSEGLYLFKIRSRLESGPLDLLEVLGIKLLPFVAVIAVQYGSMYLFDVRPLSGFMGFFVEFLWAIVPLFVISTATSWWFYRLTGKIGMGVVFNSLIISWVSASLFPFSSFM
jgi:dienelactone hydrolase